MAKKGKKDKGGEKDKGSKKVKGDKESQKEASEKKPPTEKELFELQLQQLREQLETSDESLQQHRIELESWRTRFEEEVDSEECCVAHLKRVLQRENERRSNVQEKLKTERDLGELAERRVLGKTTVAEQSHEATKSSFLQQKMELEGELFLLEERRLTKNSQRANLARVEEQLAEKMSNLRQMTREKDSEQVDRLLRNRKHFVSMCDNIKTEWKEAFKLRMPVQAKQELAENIRLRGVCRDNTRNLLKTQDRNRILKRGQKSMDLKEEILTFAEENAGKKRIYQELRIRKLLQMQQRLISGNTQGEYDNTANGQNEFENIQSSFSDPPEHQKMEACHLGDSISNSMLKGNSSLSNELRASTNTIDRETYQAPLSTKKNVFLKNIPFIRRNKIAQFRVRDICNDVDVILGDQVEYERSLQRQVKYLTQQNGIVMSAILRAGEIFESRCSKVELRNDSELDSDVLHEIRILFCEKG